MKKIRSQFGLQGVEEAEEIPLAFEIPGSDAPPKEPGDPLQGLDRFRDDLLETISRLWEACLRARQRRTDPEQILVNAWKASEKDVSLGNEQWYHHQKMLRRSWARLQALLARGRSLRERVREFVQCCAEAEPRLAALPLFQGDRDLAAERMERALIGLIDRFEDDLPVVFRKAREGFLHIAWTDAGGKLDGRWYWEGHEGDAALLLPAVRFALRADAELSAPETELLADLVQRDLRGGQLPLPRFHFMEGDEKHTRLVWKRQAVEPVPEDSVPVQLADQADEGPSPVELDLWKHHPELAEALDEALCAALRDPDELSLEEPHPHTLGTRERPHVGQVVAAIQELTGRPAAEVALLLAPLLERKLERNCADDCGRYGQALKFLEAQLSKPATTP